MTAFYRHAAFIIVLVRTIEKELFNTRRQITISGTKHDQTPIRRHSRHVHVNAVPPHRPQVGNDSEEKALGEDKRPPQNGSIAKKADTTEEVTGAPTPGVADMSVCGGVNANS